VRFRTSFSVGAILLSSVVACQRQPLETNDSGAVDGPQVRDDAATDVATKVAIPAGTCSRPDGPVRILQNERVGDLLQGNWRLCRGDAPVGSPNDKGLMVSGQLWFSLVLDDDGSLVRRNGFDAGGTIDMPNPRQVNFRLADGATFIALPSFTDEPRRMQLGGALDGVYERIP
jgi:hypothetical protein